jgi:hypothetical protein
MTLNYLDSFAVLLDPSSDACSGNSCIRAFVAEHFEFLSKKILGAYSYVQ